ncbi:Xaa-Pro dipeptidase [Biformimicrobium ophioploci]|nr:Xaa-Pro dipeptidase [Microbulbifer sp. NKW57]
MDKSLFADHMSTLRARYDRILNECDYDALYIFSGSPKRQFLDDMDYPFKVNPHFKALVPVIDNPHSWVVYRAGQKPQLLFYRPVDFWHYVPPEPNDFWTDEFDIVLIASPDEAKAHLNADKPAFLGETEKLPGWPLGDENPQLLTARLHWERAVKTPYEVACLREANRLAVAGHRAAEAAFHDGASEFEINLAYLGAAGQGENTVPYSNIVALNEHTAILHYTHLSNRRLGGDLLSFLIDAGANCYGYASDITRTYAKNGGEFADIIAAMDEMQLKLCDGLQAGVNYPDLHEQCHLGVADILKRFGVLNCEPQSAVDSGLSGTFLPHGLGHFLGLQVHDVGGHQAGPDGGVIQPPKKFPFLRTTRKVEAGHVFTIEPGLYFIDSLLADLKKGAHTSEVNWARVDAFRPFGGIRIEDNIAVYADGNENMTRDVYRG